jgi:hypothetical protein
VKNKTTLSILLSIMFIIVFYRLFPTIERSDVPTLLVFDAASATGVQSTLSVSLEDSDMVKVYTYSSKEEMIHNLVNADTPELGLVFPAGTDQAIAAGDSLELQGYALHWIGASKKASLQQEAESILGQLAGAPILIRLDGGTVYPQLDTHGIGFSFAWGMIFAILMIGISFIPNLIFEGKRTKTLDALRVSPASPLLVTISKAITGLFYGLLCLGIPFAICHIFIIQWWMAILVALCSSMFTIWISRVSVTTPGTIMLQ